MTPRNEPPTRESRECTCIDCDVDGCAGCPVCGTRPDPVLLAALRASLNLKPTPPEPPIPAKVTRPTPPPDGPLSEDELEAEVLVVEAMLAGPGFAAMDNRRFSLTREYIRNLTSLAYSRGAEQEREQACKDVCCYCRRALSSKVAAIPVFVPDSAVHWYHPFDGQSTGDVAIECSAAAIRDRARGKGKEGA